MARSNFGDGALRLIGPTTAIGVSNIASIVPVQTVTVQVVAASSGVTGTIGVDGSLDGTQFGAVVAATTFRTPVGGTAVFMTSTSADLLTQLRANLSVTGTTEDISIFVAGR